MRLFILIASVILHGIALIQTHGEAKDDPRRFVKDFEKFAQLDKDNPPTAKNLTLFTGSSTIRRWTTLSRDFPETPLLNRGFGGSQFPQIHYHFEQLFPRYKPTTIVLYCGENDLWHGKSAEDVLTDFNSLVTRIRKALPKTNLIYLSCKPSPKRMSKWKTYARFNAQVEKICKQDPLLTFVDTSAILLGPDGKPAAGIWDKDELHLNQAGYARLTKLLAPLLSVK